MVGKEAIKDFSKGVYYLNDPELIFYYITEKISYDNYLSCLKTSAEMYKNGGNCCDKSEGMVECLQIGGYTAGMLWVDHRTEPRGHVVAFYIDKNNKIRIMDIIKDDISKPYDDFDSLPDRIRSYWFRGVWTKVKTDKPIPTIDFF